MPQWKPEDARAGWRAARAIGAFAEHVAALPVPPDAARAILLGTAQSIGTRVTRRRVSVFTGWSSDAAASFGNAQDAEQTHPILSALIEGIKIIDDIQDEEAVCLATEVGVERALHAAFSALAHALELTAALPWSEQAWRAAVNAIGRGLRETAIGQELETTANGTFEGFWNVVDRKTPPLAATALELGALAAGAEPSRAAALTSLAIPSGRLLQVSDDCNDALGETATDWRTPHLNLLMLYSLSGPDGPALAGLLRDGANADSLRAAQLHLLRDGALAYAAHALLTTVHALTASVAALALPDPAPLLRSIERQRRATELLLCRSGVDEETAAAISAVPY